MLDQGLQK